MNNELNALVQRLLSGDASALDDIYSTTEGYVRAFVGKKILGKNVEACIEEIYVKFFSVAKDADLSKFDAQKVLRSTIVEVISDESARMRRFHHLILNFGLEKMMALIHQKNQGLILMWQQI